MSTYAYVDGAFLRERSNVAIQHLFGVPPDLDFANIRNVLGGISAVLLRLLRGHAPDGESAETFTARTADQRKLISKIREVTITHVRLGTLKQQQQGRRVTQKGSGRNNCGGHVQARNESSD